MLLNVILLTSSALCLLYGLVKYLGKKVAMFSVLVISAVGCFMLGHLYDLITTAIRGGIPDVFNIGMLARIGGFAFLFSASYAQMDGLVDDRSHGTGKYRALAGIASFSTFIIYLPIVLSGITVAEKVICAVIFLFASLAVFYHFKHLIIPDVSMGIISSIRTYCLFALLSDIFYCVMLTADKTGCETVKTIFAVLLAITYPLIIISMEKGRKKWIA